MANDILYKYFDKLRNNMANILSRDSVIIQISILPFTTHPNFAAQTHSRLIREAGDAITVREEYRRDVKEELSRFHVGTSNGINFKQDYLFSIEKDALKDDYGLEIDVKTTKRELSPTSKWATLLPEITKDNRIEISEFTLKNDNKQISVVLEANESADRKYSVYVEAKDLDSDSINLIVRAWGLVHETVYVYSKTKYTEIIKSFLGILGVRVPDVKSGVSFIPSDVFYHARDLKYNDFFDGGLLNGVRVGYKTDGFRRALYVHSSSQDNLTTTWLLYGNTASLVALNPWTNIPTNTILDGEYVPPYRYTDTTRTANMAPISVRFHYVVYDILIFNGRDIRSEQHTGRMSLLPLPGTRIINDAIMIIPKMFHSFSKPEELFNIIQKLEENVFASPYQTDGYIFMSNALEYRNTGIDLKNRTFASVNDIAKWKPLHRLTVDLVIHRLSSGLYGTNSLFPPVSLATLGPENISDGSVVEFRIESVIDRKENVEKLHLVPILLRIDKNKPNSSEEIASIISLHRDPITIDVLLGRSLRVMKKYHNREKRSLLSKAIELLATKSKNLIEFGAGRGATMSSWANYDKIIALEPNSESIAEMEKRITRSKPLMTHCVWPDYDSTKKVVIVQAFAQDEELVRSVVDKVFANEKATVISMMFTLTFFAGDSLRALMRNIDYSLATDGIMIYAAMDGNALSKFLNSRQIIEAKIGDNVLYSIRQTTTNDERDEPVEIFVGGDGLVGGIDDVVGDSRSSDGLITYQREFFAYPIIIADSLFNTVKTSRLGAEVMLNPYERLFSGLCVTGIFSHKHDLKIESTIEYIEGEKTVVPSARQIPQLQPATNLIALQTIPLAILKRSIAPFAKVGYYRHAAMSYEILSGFYDTILGSFFDPYYENPSKYVSAIHKIFRNPSIHVSSYELKLGIIVVTVFNELIDQIILPERPVIVLCIAKDRVSAMPYYEIISHADTIRNRVIYHTVFHHDDPIVKDQRIIASFDLENDPIIINIPSLHITRKRKKIAGTIDTTSISSSELTNAIIKATNSGKYDVDRLAEILSIVSISFDDADGVYSFVEVDASDIVFIANISEAVLKKSFAIAWGGKRFTDYAISLIVTISDLFHLSFVFDADGSTWLLGESTSDSEERKELSKYLSNLGTDRFPIDPTIIIRNTNYVVIIRSILRRTIEIYNQ